MLNLLYGIIFSWLLFHVRSFKPDCESNNQFRYNCFLVEHCDNGKCQTNWCGYHFNSTLVKIISARVLPKCAFADAPFLKRVLGHNQRIQIVSSGAFSNLPNLEHIDLSLNEISNLHRGTFKNVAATFLDLSWNRLRYIEEGAFAGLPKLQHLNLSRNELQTFPVHQLPKKIVTINLSYNLFTRFVLSSNKVPLLENVDLSHNNLDKLALQFDNSLKKIDISQNRLSAIDYTEVSYCEVVKINANKFSTVPDLLRISSLKQAAISPNPWKCDELEKLWPILSMNSVKLIDDGDGSDSQPVCGDVDFESRYGGLEKIAKNCEADANCDQEEICRSTVCVNPCHQSICDSSKTCAVSNHRVSCECKQNWKKDPENPVGPCQDVDCFTNQDCSPGSYCQNRTCIIIPPASIHGFEELPSFQRPNSAGYAAPVAPYGGHSIPEEISADGKKWWEYDI